MTKTTRIIRWFTLFACTVMIWTMDSIPTEAERVAMTFGLLMGWIMSSITTDS